MCLARFSRTLATLLASGVGILSGDGNGSGNGFERHHQRCDSVGESEDQRGRTIGDPLARSKMFPPMVVQMISIGEESGSLDPMLSKVADFYEDEVEAALESLTSAIEPVLIIGLGFMVGFIVISLFLPLIAVIQNLSGGGGG